MLQCLWSPQTPPQAVCEQGHGPTAHSSTNAKPNIFERTAKDIPNKKKKKKETKPLPWNIAARQSGNVAGTTLTDIFN